jgi:chromosome partitioning protein
MRRIGFVSEKGGVAKTTTALNVAVGLARRGHRTLLVDVDPQANASLVLTQGRGADPPTLGAVLLGEAEAADAIRPTAVTGLDLLPADVSLADANLALADQIGRERRLRVALEDVEGRYEYVLLDTSPQRSLLTVNALCYIAEAIVPVDPGLFAVAGLGQLQAAVEDVRRYLDNRALRIAGLVLTRTANNNVSRDVEAQLRGMYGDLVHPTAIPTNAKVEEAHSRYQSVLDYAPRSAGAKAYAALVEEIIAHGRRTQDGARIAARGPAEADDAAA